MVRRKPIGYFSPHSRVSTAPELTQSFQSPRRVPSHLDTSISKLKCISNHRVVSTVCNNTDVACFFCPLSLFWLSSTENAKKLRGRGDNECQIISWLLLFPGCITQSFQERQWTFCLGCSTGTLSLYFFWWLPEARLLFFLADSRCMCPRSWGNEHH